MHITELALGQEALACLELEDITTVEQLTARPADELLEGGIITAPVLYEIIHRLNRRSLTLPPIPGGRLHPPDRRARGILRLRLIDRLTLAAIGERYGIGPERVRQLLARHFGLRGKPPSP